MKTWISMRDFLLSLLFCFSFQHPFLLLELRGCVEWNQTRTWDLFLLLLVVKTILLKKKSLLLSLLIEKINFITFKLMLRTSSYTFSLINIVYFHFKKNVDEQTFQLSLINRAQMINKHRIKTNCMGEPSSSSW